MIVLLKEIQVKLILSWIRQKLGYRLISENVKEEYENLQGRLNDAISKPNRKMPKYELWDLLTLSQFIYMVGRKEQENLENNNAAYNLGLIYKYNSLLNKKLSYDLFKEKGILSNACYERTIIYNKIHHCFTLYSEVDNLWQIDILANEEYTNWYYDEVTDDSQINNLNDLAELAKGKINIKYYEL